MKKTNSRIALEEYLKSAYPHGEIQLPLAERDFLAGWDAALNEVHKMLVKHRTTVGAGGCSVTSEQRRAGRAEMAKEIRDDFERTFNEQD